jgi:hypothetical protein
MTGREKVTIDDIKDMRTHIEEIVNEKSFISKVLGFFTFINILWFGSIVGMVCMFPLAIHQVFGPWIEAILKSLF